MNPENIRGIDVSYAMICDRRLWFSLHGDIIKDGTEFIANGKYLNDKNRKYKYKQIKIGRNIIDYVEVIGKKYIIHEYKRGRNLLDADLFQIAHYMYLLKRNDIYEVEGYVHLLGSKDIKKVELNDKIIKMLQDIYKKIEFMYESDMPSLKKNNYCFKGCSMVEFCWGKI